VKSRFLAIFRKSEILQNASILVSGTIMAQAIPILLQPFFRRYFSPHDFGVYSVYSSLIGILLVISSFRYEQAIVLPKRNRDASVLVTSSILFSFVFSFLLFIAIILFRKWIGGVLNLDDSDGFILYLIPIGVFLLSVFQVFNFWLIRQKKFVKISVNKLVRRIVEGGAQSAAALIHYPKGLVLGDVAGQVGNAVTSAYQSVRCGYSPKHFSIARSRELLIRYSDFPRYSLAPALCSTIGFLLPVVLINRFYLPEQAGFFDLAKLILSVPMALIATSISSVVLQKASESYRLGRSFVDELKPLTAIVFVISVAEVLLIALAGKDIFRVFFGKIWETSGIISQLLVWPFALNFITSSFTSLFVALNKIRWQSIWQVVYFLLIISLSLFQDFTFNGFIRIYASIEIVANLAMVVLLIIVVVGYEKKIKMVK